MFEEQDWNDDAEARTLTDAVFPKQASLHCLSNWNTQSKRKKQKLLETLKMLRAAGAPEGSPADAEADLEHGTARKTGGRKRNRSNRGKEGRGGESGWSGEPRARGPETGLEEPAKPGPEEEERRRAAGGDGLGGARVGEASRSLAGSTGAGTLTRKQWRNRRKNKQRNKNKFRPVDVRPAQGECDSTDTVQEGGSVAVIPRSPGKETRRKGPAEEAVGVEEPAVLSTLPQSSDRSTALRTKMQERLKSARFRFINEQLYTSSSAAARKLFAQDASAFRLYHQGFNAQLQHWPQNPVDCIIRYLRNRPRSAVVADFGCGDCKIARSVGNKVHSFDLVALSEHVTVCDMAKVPLSDESVDIVVFCLSLMGTNLVDFLMEANRVLRVGGILKIAEVASRFEDVRRFIGILGALGFKLLSKDTENGYFYMFDFGKTGLPRERSKLPQLELKPCLYKKR
ncbi:ribosomal RNA-processing protein 8 [Pristis pectinata]|uniref:ribosomal RNA-processing protein 8 n=1 Tax=Pristis pectinata TaxID=685728 RepID=UPI00223DFF2B|nr:ribosomal RNA-processing protein 8 [Pristis pectinata]XP_051882430.1 ribosomal RNA-processing protein 8 [Pristis pectinata]